MNIIYSTQSAVGSLVDSSESVIVAVALRLLRFTLRPACVLVFLIIYCAVVIYCVELNHFAVNVRRIVVHDK